MTRNRFKSVWVAVRIERGFVSDMRGFEEEELALRQERSWRRRMNPDYDETGVGKVRIVAAKTSAAPPRRVHRRDVAVPNLKGKRNRLSVGNQKRKAFS